jgi:hypothetical protein
MNASDTQRPDLVEKMLASGPTSQCSDALGRFLALQTSTRIAGAFLDLTDQVPLSTIWIHSGLQDMSKLVTVGEDDSLLQQGRDLLGFDLRLAFHRQDLHGFINDMAKQKFDFIHCAYPTAVVKQSQVVHLLEMGGMAVFSHPKSLLLAEEAMDEVKLHKWQVMAGGQPISLVTKGSIIRKRRGGRNRNHG